MKIIHEEIIDFRSSKSVPNSCHASSVVFYEDEPYFACFGGSREGNPDVGIFVHHDGKNILIGSKDQVPRWNPILHVVGSKLFLWEKVGIFCDRWQTFVSDITGVKFTENMDYDTLERRIIPAGLNGPVKTKPIHVDDLIYCGSSVETLANWSSYIEVYDRKFKFLGRSNPLSATSKILSGRLTLGIIQPSLWIDDKEVMHAFFRSSRGLGKIYHSSSIVDENGLYLGEWKKPKATAFENPNSGMDTVYHEGQLFMVHNPSAMVRYPLVLSRLNGRFQEKEKLVIKDKVDVNDRPISYELSYPYMIEHDGKLHLTYTYGRSKIVYVVIEI